jgi:hypothetical protein
MGYNKYDVEIRASERMLHAWASRKYRNLSNMFSFRDNQSTMNTAERSQCRQAVLVLSRLNTYHSSNSPILVTRQHLAHELIHTINDSVVADPNPYPIKSRKFAIVSLS